MVRPGDTLWSLAATHLGNPNRWNELFETNRGRVEPGGNLVNPNLIYAGWTLKFPVGATGISPHTTPTRATTAQGSKRAATVLASNLAAGQGNGDPASADRFRSRGVVHMSLGRLRFPTDPLGVGRFEPGRHSATTD